MNLEIQSRHVGLDPDWRDLIERLSEGLSAHYPGLLRLHVTVSHGRHHRTGSEEVALLANDDGTPVRVAKVEANVHAAIRAAFQAMEIELARLHPARRRVGGRQS